MSHARGGAKVKRIKGRIQQAVGIVTGNAELEREGSRRRAEGVAYERTLQMRRKLGDFFERAAKRFKA
jgi:uncharacterized protein YjbJ (UPF0337 family)